MTWVEGAAKAAGLKIGDIVIAVEGKPCNYHYASQIDPHPKKLNLLPGDTWEFTVVREGKKEKISVKFACEICGESAKCPLAADKSIIPTKNK